MKRKKLCRYFAVSFAFVAMICMAMCCFAGGVLADDNTSSITIQKEMKIRELYQTDYFHRNESFAITVTLGDDSISGTYGDIVFSNGVGTVSLKNEETAVISNLPIGTAYTVSCESKSGWLAPKYTNESGTVSDGGNTVKVTTELDSSNCTATSQQTYLIHGESKYNTDGSIKVGDKVTTLIQQPTPSQPGLCGLFALHEIIPYYYTLDESSIKVEAVYEDGTKKVLTPNVDYLLEVQKDIAVPTQFGGSPYLPSSFNCSTIKILYYKSSSCYMPPFYWNNTENLTYYKSDADFQGGREPLTKAVRVDVYFDETLNENAITGQYMLNRSLSTQLLNTPSETRSRGYGVSNYSYLGGVSIIKTNENSEPLSGAEFALYATKEDAENGLNPIKKAASNENGIVSWDKLVYAQPGQGKSAASKEYWVCETKAPNGYSLNSEPVKVVVNANTHNMAANELTNIVNTKNTDTQTISVSVNKKWVDGDSSNRPDSVFVQLYKDGTAYGQMVELSSANDWTYVWSNLDKSSNWSVDEIDTPDNYTKNVTQSGNNWVITNTLNTPTPPSDDEAPKTGENHYVGILAVVLIVSVCIVVATLRNKKSNVN